MFSIILVACVGFVGPDGPDGPPPAKAWVVTETAKPKSYVAGTKTMKVFSMRAPRGDHTHTCTTCGATWDHSANSTHKCQFCGGSPPTEIRYDKKGNAYTVYLADSVRRPVTIATTKTVPVIRDSRTTGPTVKQSLPVQPVAYELPPILPSLGSSVSAGNCANGQCSTITTSRGWGVFGPPIR